MTETPPAPDRILLYQLRARPRKNPETLREIRQNPDPEAVLWEILLDPEQGNILWQMPGSPAYSNVLGRIQTPAEIAAGGLSPAELESRAAGLFRHAGDAGPHPTATWFAERLYEAGWEPAAAAPGQGRLTPQLCHAYGIPRTLPRAPEDPGRPPALKLPHPLDDCDHVWALYAPDPENPALWQASRFSRPKPPGYEPQTRERTPPLPPGDPKAANSWRRHLWKNLKKAGHNKAGARRLRERRVRAALGLHPAWGQIGPFKHPSCAHSNWFRKAERDKIRAAAAAAKAAAAAANPPEPPPAPGKEEASGPPC